VVRYTFYDPSGRQVFVSRSYFVTAYTGGPGTAAFATPDASQPGMSTTYTNLRSTIVTDALSHATTTTFSVECGEVGDSACYVFTASVDPLHHQNATYTDALGRTAYTRTYTGNSSSTDAAYATIKDAYNYLGQLVWVQRPNGISVATYSYDDAGRQTGMTDPDRGTESYSYDQNGNLIHLVDGRGSAGTVFVGYDGLNRQLWRNTTNSPTGAYVTYSYDSTQNGNLGIGRLTGETFTDGPTNSLSGAYSFVYDGRGQPTQATVTLGGMDYTLQATYDDAGNLLTQTDPYRHMLPRGASASRIWPVLPIGDSE
jgi:YD repeat-containing protein